MTCVPPLPSLASRPFPALPLPTPAVTPLSRARELEPLPGAVVMQFIRCGKRGCRCQAGERHGPYYYRVWRDGSHVRKVYVPVTQVGIVQQQCAAYQAGETQMKRLRAEGERLRQSVRLQYARLEQSVRWGAAWDHRGNQG